MDDLYLDIEHVNLIDEENTRYELSDTLVDVFVDYLKMHFEKNITVGLSFSGLVGPRHFLLFAKPKKKN